MRTVAVLGTGRSGIASAKALLKEGSRVLLLDEATEATNPEAVSELALAGADVRFGVKTPFDFGDAKELVVSPGAAPSSPVVQAALGHGMKVLSEIELAYQVAKAPIVAITGTNGKSTTTVMTYLAFRGARLNVVLCGNIHGSGYPEVPLTQAASESPADAVLVAEVSSFHFDFTHAFKPKAAAITNITQDHLDRHGTVEAYRAAKMRIFENQDASDLAVIPNDDPLFTRPSGPRIRTFGATGADAEVLADGVRIDGQTISAAAFPFKGVHNLRNAAVAMLLAQGFGVPIKASMKGLQEFKGLQNRMEVVAEKGGVTVINNSMCTNPDAVVASSGSLSQRQHLLIGGVDKDLDFAPLRRYLESSPHRAYIYGRDGRSIKDALGTDGPVFENMPEAFQQAIQAAKPGEVVMLAPGCASFDEFKDFVDRGNVFRKLAKEWSASK
ncbi:MAG: UDP-N-acetylmuramoyl-L-alanine--D-glutamate ligase [Armatimonadetes bacterium]|nr:UDP-N-acetylmuramoyl-L-alanine--D-glutamate ligase [Armatimonadota bacterium]